MPIRTYAGERLRSLRSRSGLNQREMANKIGVSVSYLSQLESDDRPVTDAVLTGLSKSFPDQWADFTASPEETFLARALIAAADPLVGQVLSEDVMQRVARRHPTVLSRLVATHEALQRAHEQLRMLDDVLERSSGEPTLPWDEVRDWFHVNGNYVDSLDKAAERLAASIEDLSDHSIEPLRGRLANAHGVQLSSEEFSPPGVIRSYDEEKRRLTVERALPLESRRFLIAHQLVRLELGADIDAVAATARLTSPASARLLSIGLSNYAAGALLMPYVRFRGAAHELRHDVDALATRFAVSFEQVCHRLSTLQRPGAEGIPFFFCRVDLAGNITKRHSATRLQFARYGGGCPIWIVHEAVAIPERILVQLAETPDGIRYVSMAKGIVKPSCSYRQPVRRYAVTLGCDAEHADKLIYADELDIRPESTAAPIGVSCRICPRDSCEQRAFPPTGRQIEFNPDWRGIVPYQFA